MGLTATALLMAVTLLLGGPATVAQEATPAIPPVADRPGTYPVAIHRGTCEAPVAQPVYGFDPPVPVGADQPDAEVLGQPLERPVLISRGSIDASLEDIANAGHVLAIHASVQGFGTILACGQIAGPDLDGLTIALIPVGDSTIAGIAVFSTDSTGVLGLGEDELKVAVYVIETGAVAPAEPTAATPIDPADAPQSSGTPAARAPAVTR